jgi:protocatechuate 3,4-dioxygenase beta subunit
MRRNYIAVFTLGVLVVFVGKLPSVQGQAAATGVSSESGKIAGKQITYTGKVVDEQGQPIADAKVSLHQITYGGEASPYDVKSVDEVKTKADGAFSFRIVADTEGYRQGIIVAEKQGLAVGWDNWEMRQDKQTDITLCQPKQLTGLVIGENSNPIADAEVSISFALAGQGDDRRYLTNQVAPQLLTVKTDASGKFTFERLPADATFEFGVKKAGRATVSTFNSTGYHGGKLQFVPGQTDIKLIVPIEARIEGTVVEKTSGKPVAGVKLVVLEQQRGLPFDLRTIVSKEDGTFSMDSLTAGKHLVQIVPQAEGTADWVAEKVEVTTEAGKTTAGLKVEVSKGGLLEVVVKEAETKKPVEKAGVSVRDQQNDTWLSARSDKDGVARIRLTPGEYQIGGVYRQGYTSDRRQEPVTIEDGATKRVEWLLTSQPKIVGVVQDEAGNPVEGVKFKILPAGGPEEATSDSQGKFEQSWDPARWGSQPTVHYLVARHKGRNLAAAVEINEDAKTVDVKLRPGVVFTGKVVDPNGKGIAGAQISVMLRASNWGSSIEYRETKTDAQGGFQVNAIPLEHRYSVTAMADGYGQKEVEAHAADAVDNRLDAGQLELAAANLSVSGVVVDVNDKPVTGARVNCYGGDGQPQREAQADAEGKFTLDKVCQGRIRISASVSGRTSRYGYVETEGGAADVKVVVSESSSGTRYVPKQPPSLVGKALPELKDMGIELPPLDTQGKMVLVCFWDMQQRPSRHCITELVKQAEQLKEKAVIIIATQAANIDENALNEWVKKYNIPFPVGTVKGDVEKTKFAWGVRSLPWLILTDRKHVITAEGFSVTELDKKIKEASDANQ